VRIQSKLKSEIIYLHNNFDCEMESQRDMVFECDEFVTIVIIIIVDRNMFNFIVYLS